MVYFVLGLKEQTAAQIKWSLIIVGIETIRIKFLPFPKGIQGIHCLLIIGK